MSTYDQNGNRITRSVSRETAPDGTPGWGCTVWFGGGLPGSIATNVTRYVYRSRREARAGDISDGLGRYGRIS